MPDFRQHDASDCGVACLAYVFHRYGLSTSLAALRQQAGTNRSGTTALGLVDTARALGFEAKGLRCRFEDLRHLALPGIAHVVTGEGRPHFVVVTALRKRTLRIMDPACGRVESWSLDRFRGIWTNVFLILSPAPSFVPGPPAESAWNRLVRLLAPQKATLTQAFVGALLTTVLSLSTAVYIQKIVDHVIVDGNGNLLRLLGISMLALLVLRVAIGYFQSILLLRSAQLIDAGLIMGYYRHLLRLPQSFFDTMRIGEITSRVRDAVAIRDFLNGTILNLMVQPLILVVALGAMWVYSWKLALFTSALLPAQALIYWASDWINRRHQREIMERSADFDSQLVESLHAMSVVRSAGLQDEMAFRSETRLVRLLKRVWAAGRANFLVGGLGSLATQGYAIGLLWLGATLVLQAELTAGELMSCHALAAYITGPAAAILGLNTSIRSATTATDRLYAILDLECERDEGQAELRLPGEFEVALERVGFRYPGRSVTLEDVSVCLRSGTITALVGSSGCGKSTLLSLLQRHYEPDRGQIRLAGVPLLQIPLKALRTQIAYVPQRIDLLAGTILENLAPQTQQPDVTRINELCRGIGILDAIETLPRGLQTAVTENGANFSGGQKQRLAIVRALYGDAPIILMDEPSSALDAEAEGQLMQLLVELRDSGKLIVLAVHNQRLLQLCDQVVHLRDGRVVAIEHGSRESDSVAAPREPAAGLPSRPAEVVRAQTFPDAWREMVLARRSQGILLGQTDANVMGIDADGRGWFLDEMRCDFRDAGGDAPAVFGFDVGPLTQGWAAACGYLVPRLRAAHQQGAWVLLTWHPENLVTGEDSWSGAGVADILPGGAAHRVLRERLDTLCDQLGNLQDEAGAWIPILFRCWHQQNADHFWWGRGRCTVEEYQRLFRFTAAYIRETRKVRNFLFCFSAAEERPGTDPLFSRYPGHNYVDVVGLDWFGDHSPEASDELRRQVAHVVEFAGAHQKVPAITALGYAASRQNRGLRQCPVADWFSTHVAGPLTAAPAHQRVAFAALWRNEAYNPAVYNVPPASCRHVEAFRALCENPQFRTLRSLSADLAPSREPSAR